MVKHTQTIQRQQPTNCLSVFDHFVWLALKGLIEDFNNCKPVTRPVFTWLNEQECCNANIAMMQCKLSLGSFISTYTKFPKNYFLTSDVKGKIC